ncbi:MAG TPA: carboxypeptidase-like regulatory domain-containing protein, partial [Vicinamibacterales bacterium]|nr:carboxypeptidase-like regulatory domain-containing protein [Vicinamibacterales bacterium]
MLRRISRLVFVGFAMAYAAGLSLSTVVSGQALTGEIRLDVRDPSGASMSASGTLQNLATGVVRPFQTKADGSITLSDLPLGRYRVDIARAGF